MGKHLPLGLQTVLLAEVGLVPRAGRSPHTISAVPALGLASSCNASSLRSTLLFEDSLFRG